MKRIPTLLAVAAIAALSAALPAAADSLSLSFSQNWAENFFQTRLPGADAVTVAGLSWEKSLSAFSLMAGAEYSALRVNTGLNSASFSAGVDYLYAASEKTALYLSLMGDTALFRSEYADFNHSAARFSAALKSYVSPSSILKASAVSEYRSYRYTQFDFFSQGMAVSLDKYFPSRTTLQAELGWGYKYFLHPQVIVAAVVPASGMLSTLGGQGGTGLAWRGGRGGPGRYALTSTRSEGKSIQIASLQGRVAQGLGDRIGLRLAGIVQWNLSGENPFTTVEEYALIENPTNDMYAWKGTGWNAQLTLLLPWNVEARLGYTRSDKTFPGIESLDLDGTSLGLTRKDGRDQLEVKLEKNFIKWSAVLSYAYIRNRSNDPLFDWRGQFISGGLQWNFNLGGQR
jgi:hypothetical protein